MTQPHIASRPTALITGASSGIGATMAEQLAARGVQLILVARSQDQLHAVAGRLSAQYGVRAEVVPADLTRPDAPLQIEQAVAALGLTVDFLINNAGFASYGEFHTLPLDHELEMIQVNVAALTHLTRRFLPGMVERRRGRVLNVASTAAFLPGPLMAVYYATKAYVLSFSESLQEELRGSGVHVTALCPGPVETGFQARARMEASRLLSPSATRSAMMLSTTEVARQGLDAMFRGQAVRVPGVANRLLTFLPRLLPRAAVPPLMKNAQARQPS